MNVVVDTPVLSAALRHKPPGLAHRREIERLTDASRLLLLGVIRQEVLSGVHAPAEFDFLRGLLRPFPDVPVLTEDYERAAQFFNDCRRRGVQGSHADFLICAIGHRLSCSVYTTDRDFQHYSRHIPVVIHEIGDD